MEAWISSVYGVRAFALRLTNTIGPRGKFFHFG